LVSKYIYNQKAKRWIEKKTGRFVKATKATFQVTKNMIFSPNTVFYPFSTGKYRDRRTGRFLSRKEIERRIKISVRIKQKRKEEKIFRSTIGSIVYTHGEEHDFKVVLVSRKQIDEKELTKILTKELFNWYYSDYEDKSSPPRNVGFEFNEIVDKEELPKGFKFKKGEKYHIFRLFDDKLESEKNGSSYN